MTQSPALRAPWRSLALVTAILLPALLLGGCDAIYDDTKGWANRLEARILEKAHELSEEDTAEMAAVPAGEPAPPAVPVEPVETVQLKLAQPEAAPEAKPATPLPAMPLNGDPGVMAAPAMPAQTMTAKAPALPINGDPGVTAAPADAQMAAAPASDAEKVASSKDAKALPPHPVPKPEVPSTLQAKAGAPAPKAADAAHAVVLHLSSLRSEAAAKREWSDLQENFPRPLAGMSAEIQRTELGEKGTFYRVLAGPLPSPDTAREVCAELKAKNARQYCRILPSKPGPS